MKNLIGTIIVAIILYFLLVKVGIINDEVKNESKKLVQQAIENIDKIDDIN